MTLITLDTIIQYLRSSFGREKKNRLPVLHLAMVQYKTWPGRLWRLARHTSPDNSTSHISMHVTTLCKTIPSHAELGLR